MASFHSNSALFLSLLVAVSAFMAAPSSVEAQIPGIPSNLLPGLVSITGIVNCVPSVNGTSTSNLPPFANATVMLRCGNTTVSTTNTDLSGIFSIVSNALSVIGPVFSFLFGGGSTCQLIVKQPLSMCNVTLPSTGNLVSQLPLTTIPIVGGALTIISSPFMLLPNIFS